MFKWGMSEEDYYNEINDRFSVDADEWSHREEVHRMHEADRYDDEVMAEELEHEMSMEAERSAYLGEETGLDEGITFPYCYWTPPMHSKPFDDRADFGRYYSNPKYKNPF